VANSGDPERPPSFRLVCSRVWREAARSASGWERAALRYASGTTSLVETWIVATRAYRFKDAQRRNPLWFRASLSCAGLISYSLGA
jgi:hypothetical protein